LRSVGAIVFKYRQNPKKLQACPVHARGPLWAIRLRRMLTANFGFNLPSLKDIGDS
jgi:hypothetical protein